MHKPIKSANIISATGLFRANAAPAAVPAIPASDIGISMTLSAPNFPNNPPVTPKTPPIASGPPGLPVPPTTSSPMTITFSSLAIS